MIAAPDRPRDRTIGSLVREALWFLFHTAVAIGLVIAIITVMTLNHPDPDSAGPKVTLTVLAFLMPMFAGLIASRMQHNSNARHIWISGLVLFTIACVWVLDLPTGKGLCENCGSVEKVWRTIFSFSHGSGLMSGDGPLIGAWMPLSMISYAFGARFGLEP
ncbi:hypothetical protein GCM10011507_06700 [Edaphobacter acidisoli]|uniref:Uncharacterized protein n=1 Tax=Edaphobacter acidisoli TaxID=2040573 RepID=A0A916RJD2_9BACT|nr:hypothetical protein [Edaphobacter acidisoli]GGA58009.1 hypothetical protein GCM10011507_06700 [Edaphobacter acidisoli]